MRACVQRVRSASVTVDAACVGSIGRGLVILLGVHADDAPSDVKYLVSKIAELRMFADEEDKMNRSLLEVQGEALVISQFTLWGDCRKGRRPSFVAAAPPELAEPLYRSFVEDLRDLGVRVATGVFRVNMQVTLTNDGPVTLWLDSRKTL